VANLDVKITPPMVGDLTKTERNIMNKDPFCRALSNEELMQRLIQIFSSGGRGSYPSAARASEALAALAELIRRLDTK